MKTLSAFLSSSFGVGLARYRGEASSALPSSRFDRRALPALLVVLSWFCVLPAPVSGGPGRLPVSPAPRTGITMHSDEGHNVGRGLDYSFDTSTGSFQIDASALPENGAVESVYFYYFVNGVPDWTYNFRTTTLDALEVGLYRDAAGPGSGHPYMNIGGGGSGCGGSGNFVVLDIDVDSSQPVPIVNRFAVFFEHHCDGEDPALVGTIYYNHIPTTSLTVSTPAPDSDAPTLVTVSLLEPAPAGGAVVRLETTDQTIAPVPQSVFLPAGSSSTSFSVDTLFDVTEPSAVITATYDGVASAARLSIPSPVPLTDGLFVQTAVDSPFGNGREYVYPDGSGSFNVAPSSSTEGGPVTNLDVRFSGADHGFWYITLSSAGLGVPIGVGSYPDAQAWPDTSPGRPSIGLGGGGVGCTGTGQFEIKELVLDTSAPPVRVVSLAATFEFECCCGQPGVVTGQVFVNSSVGPPDGPEVTSVELRGRKSRTTLVITGAGFSSTARVLVDGFGFAEAATVEASGTVISQRGRRTDGTKLKRAFPRGHTVPVVIENGDGGHTVTSFTRKR